MKYSLAIMLLLGAAKAWNIDQDEQEMTLQSIKDAERESGKKIDFQNKGMMKNALAENNKLKFNGEEFSGAEQTHEVLVQVPVSHEIRYFPGVRFVQVESDPIYGSLGPPKVDPADLTPEQKFELDQRKKKPAAIVLDEHIQATDASIKQAEKMVGAKMPSPDDPEQKKKFEEEVDTPFYHYHTAEEETEDTKETRRSIKTAEKMLKHRFFINKKDKKQYEKDVAAGLVNPKQATFEEDEDEELGPKAKKDENAEANKAEEKKIKEDEAKDATKTKEEKAEAAKEEKVAKAKEETAGDLPPELAGAAIQTRMEELGIKYPIYA